MTTFYTVVNWLVILGYWLLIAGVTLRILMKRRAVPSAMAWLLIIYILPLVGLTDRYNGYQQRDVVTAGYGRQILNGPVHSLRFEFGPGVRYDEYTDGDTDTQPLGYASGTWAWQMTDNAKFSQGVSVFGAEDTTVNSESALNVAINAHFALKVAYNVTWNSEPPASAPEHTDRRTSLSLGYKM